MVYGTGDLTLVEQYRHTNPPKYCIDPPGCRDRDDAIFMWSNDVERCIFVGMCIANPKGELNPNVEESTYIDGRMVKSIWVNAADTTKLYSLRDGVEAFTYISKVSYEGTILTECIFKEDGIKNVVQADYVKVSLPNSFVDYVRINGLHTQNGLECMTFTGNNEPLLNGSCADWIDQETAKIDIIRTVIAFLKKRMFVYTSLLIKDGVKRTYQSTYLTPLRYLNGVNYLKLLDNVCKQAPSTIVTKDTMKADIGMVEKANIAYLVFTYTLTIMVSIGVGILY